MCSVHVKPWQDFKEWKAVYRDIWSGDQTRISVALKKIHNWGLTGELPFELEVTALLLETDIRSKEQDLDSIAVEALYSSAVIRLMAAVKDNPSLLNIKPDAQLPLSILQYRNDFVHSSRPSFETAKIVANTALQFLKVNYWDFLEALPPDEKFSELVEKYFALWNQSLETDGATSNDCKKQSMRLLKAIERETDCETLIDFILSNVALPQASTESFNSYVQGLKSMAAFFGDDWCTQFAAIYLQKAIEKIKETEELQELTKLQNLAIVVASLPLPDPSTVDSVVIDDLFQKFFYMIKRLVSIQIDISDHQASMDSLLETLSKLLDWLSSLCKLDITKSKLRIVYDETVKSPLLKEQRGFSLNVKQSRVGVFYTLSNWAPCKIGALPHNYKAE